MRRVMVRYTVRPDAVQRNEQLVREVYDELAAAQPGGFRYATFKLDDGVSFVHLAEHEDGANPLAEAAAFGRFQASLRERCDSPPVLTELSEVGSYRFFGGAS
jgi:hypothetical protein